MASSAGENMFTSRRNFRLRVRIRNREEIPMPRVGGRPQATGKHGSGSRVEIPAASLHWIGEKTGLRTAIHSARSLRVPVLRGEPERYPGTLLFVKQTSLTSRVTLALKNLTTPGALPCSAAGRA